MKYLKYYESFLGRIPAYEENPYNIKDTTRTDKRILHLSYRLINFFKSIGMECIYEPLYRPTKITGTNKIIRDGEHHTFILSLDSEKIKKYSVAYYLLHNEFDLFGKNIEFSINISCPTLSKEIPQFNLGDDMWEKSIQIIKNKIKDYIFINDDIGKAFMDLINSNVDYDVKNKKDIKEPIIPESVLKQIMLNISNSDKAPARAAEMRKHNINLYNKIMELYNKIKDRQDDTPNVDLEIAADLSDTGFMD